MKLCEKIHQIKIDFQVTEQVKRYVYVYLLESESCYLIDSGVFGSEQIISDYMNSIGRNLTEIKGIFLTHSHPDHIGGAARLKELTGGRIYASQGEKKWIEDVDLQYRERPIPNFYRLAGAKSVKVDQTVAHGESVLLEKDMQLEVIGTDGHSMDDVSYLLRDQGILFAGDAIPVPGDIPIYMDCRKSMESLKRIAGFHDTVQLCCPAWDKAYQGDEISKAVEDGMKLMKSLDSNICRLVREEPRLSEKKYTALLCEKMGTPQFLNNPLFMRTVRSHMESFGNGRE